MRPIRQGDVILLPTTKVLGDELPHLTLVEGISTGHSHRISKGIATLFSHQGELYLQVCSRLAILSHDEHRPLKVHHGNWKVYIQREYAPQKKGKFSLRMEQDFITEDNADEEFLRGFEEGVRASSEEQLVANVLAYHDETTLLTTKSSAQRASKIQNQSRKKAGRAKTLSNWKYVVD